MSYKCKKNNSSLKRKVTYKKYVTSFKNKEFSTDWVTDWVTLSVKSRPQFSLMNTIYEAVKFPVALIENAKLTLTKKMYVTVRF